MKASGVYQIVNTITGDFYIGSSIDLERRKREHFNEYTWKQRPNMLLYKYMKQYGKDNFLFKPIWLCNPNELKRYEQLAIEKYNPQYNICAAYTGLTKEEYDKKYYNENAYSIKQQHKQYRKENADSIKQYQKQYRKEHADSMKQYQKQYQKQYHKEHSDSLKQYQKQYYNQQCLYKNELLTLSALKNRFARQGIEYPTQEAKKYLIELL